MIIPITGNVQYNITMDPTVWIFDDRKIVLEEAFDKNNNQLSEDDHLENVAKRWNSDISPHSKPPVNRSISRLEGKKILTQSYVMPIRDFIEHAEINSDAKKAIIGTKNGDVTISIEDLQQSYLLFAIDGKPLKDDGPAHIIYKDGSNKDNPIKAVQKITIK